MLSLGDLLAILAAPVIGGTWATCVAMAVAASRKAPIDEVVRQGERAGLFGAFALVPPSIVGFFAGLIFFT